MSEKRISLAKVVKVIEGRRAVCLDAAARHKSEGDDEMAASERCAAMELGHVLDLLTGRRASPSGGPTNPLPDPDNKDKD